ncbi:hypothetical protein [Nocardioides sp. InS609-2]|uniref:hypothetical protein n=1 Tax=Nocardioides sp. InS609-2 TaxID=2760705 RepID=UPI0020BFD0D4|nr:hypothetical protein [Nocardioides sp. InS609-2]
MSGDSEAAASGRFQKSSTARMGAAAAFAVLLAGSAMTGWHWRTHPTAFPSAGNGWGSESFPVGKTHYVAMVGHLEDAERVRIDRVTPVFMKNTARAEVRFLVCTIDPASGVGGVGLVGRRSFNKTCPEPVPAEGAWFEPDDSAHQDIVMAITPRTDGAVNMSAIEITYTQGWQHGTQVTGPSYEAPYRAP